MGLAKVGRLTLILSILNSLPVYYLSLYRMPKGVISKIEQIQRRFLWAGHKEGGFVPPVNWRIVQAPKGLGGLRLGSLATNNASLLFKWWWIFGHDRQGLWCSVVSTIHNIPADCSIPVGLVPKCPGTWKGITDILAAPTQARQAL